MSDSIILYGLNLKRLLKDKGLILSFLLLPLFIFLTSILWTENNNDVLVGVYFEDVEFRIPNTNIFTFITEESEIELRDHVDSNLYDVGYIIHKDLIEVLESSNSSLTTVINEIIYANHFLEFGYQLALDYMKDLEGLDTQVFIENSKVRIKNVNKIELAFDEINQVSSLTEISMHQAIRGIIAVFLMFSVLISSTILYDDRKSGVYRRILPISGKNKISLFFHAAIGSLSFFISLLSIGIAYVTLALPTYGISKEILVLFSYIVCLIGISALLSRIIKKKEVFVSFLPFIVVASVIISPIFIDITQFIPVLGFLHFLIPSALYLNGLDGNLLISFYMLLYGVVTYYISFLIRK